MMYQKAIDKMTIVFFEFYLSLKMRMPLFLPE